MPINLRCETNVSYQLTFSYVELHNWFGDNAYCSHCPKYNTQTQHTVIFKNMAFPSQLPCVNAWPVDIRTLYLRD